MFKFNSKKILVILVTVMVLSVVFSAFAFAAPPADNKVDICHFQAKDEPLTLSDGTTIIVPAGWYFINVSVKSFEKHHMKHGDFSFMPGVDDPEETRCKGPVEEDGLNAQPFPPH